MTDFFRRSRQWLSTGIVATLCAAMQASAGATVEGQAAAVARHTPTDVYQLFEKTKAKRIYLSVGDMSIHAEYLIAKDKRPVLFVQGLKNTGSNERFRNLPPNDPAFRERFSAAVDDDLLMRLCGDSMGGDDSCDYFSLIGQSTTTGNQITEQQRERCRTIVQAIGDALVRLSMKAALQH